jgi:hypothetical protein
MAPTLLLKSARKQYNVQAPPPSCATSPMFQMPNVFVIPPEEEQFQTPPWCYFDAAHTIQRDLSTPPDFESLDVALDVLCQAEHNDDTPEFWRSSRGGLGNVVMPKKWEGLSETRTVFDHPRDDVPDVPDSRPTETGNDSEIVEVVKVKKRQVSSEIVEMKKSKTFKARASRAFQSIKNVGRSTQRKSSVKEIWPSSRSLYSMDSRQTLRQSQEVPSSSPQAHDRTLPRRASITLFHLFQPPENSSRFSASDPSASTHPPPLSSQVSFPETISTGAVEPCCSLAMQADSPTNETDRIQPEEPRSASPCPSTTKSFRQRFSALDLHRLFSFSQSVSKADPTPLACRQMTSTTSISSTSTMSRGPSTISSASDTPDTPMDEMCQMSESEHRKLGTVSHNPLSYCDRPRTLQDISFEMRLDSLHFDSLSFDADNF